MNESAEAGRLAQLVEQLPQGADAGSNPARPRMPKMKSFGRFSIQRPDGQDLPLTPEAKAFRESLRTPEERARRERVFAVLSQIDYASMERRLLQAYGSLAKEG